MSVSYEHGERLIQVLGGNRSMARGLHDRLMDMAELHARLGQNQLSAEVEHIAVAVLDMAESAWRAHGQMMAEQSQNTANEIGTIIATVLGDKA